MRTLRWGKSSPALSPIPSPFIPYPFHPPLNSCLFLPPSPSPRAVFEAAPSFPEWTRKCFHEGYDEKEETQTTSARGLRRRLTNAEREKSGKAEYVPLGNKKRAPANAEQIEEGEKEEEGKEGEKLSYEGNGSQVGMKKMRGMWTTENERELIRVVEEKKAGGRMPDGGWDEVAKHMRAYDGGVHKTSFNGSNCRAQYRLLNLKPK